MLCSPQYKIFIDESDRSRVQSIKHLLHVNFREHGLACIAQDVPRHISKRPLAFFDMHRTKIC